MADTDELNSRDFLDAPGDLERLVNLGITRSRRLTRALPRYEEAEVDTNEARQLYNFIWDSKSTLDNITTHIFQIVYKRHLAANKGDERRAKQATQETLGNISDHIFNKYKNTLLTNIKTHY